MITLAAQTVQSAQAANVAGTAASANGALPIHWPLQGEMLNWSQQIGPGLAALMVLMGVVYLLFGFNIFKALVVLNAAVLGAVIGWIVGDRSGNGLPAAIICAFICAVVTYPMIKWAIAIMGGLCGAVIGVSLWRAFNLDANFAWAGAGMGLIFFGLLTFILFRGCVMTYMSLQGASMLIFGLLSLLFKYEGMTPKVNYCLTCKPFLLPMLVFIPTVLGVIFQQNHVAAGGPPVKK